MKALLEPTTNAAGDSTIVSALFCEESAAQIRTVDIHEIQAMSPFVSVVVLMRKAAAGLSGVSKDSVEAAAASTHSKRLDALGKFVLGDTIIDFSAMEAWREGKPIVFTAMEFKVLKYMIENQKRAISRDELLNNVWGYDNYPCTRTVDNHILRLRKKLEREPSRPRLFITVHGHGYKLLSPATVASLDK